VPTPPPLLDITTLTPENVLRFKRTCGCYAPAGERATIFSISQHRDAIIVSNVSGERKAFSAEEAKTYFTLFS